MRILAVVLVIAVGLSTAFSSRVTDKPHEVRRRFVSTANTAALTFPNGTDIVTRITGSVPEALFHFYSIPRSIIDIVQPGLPYAVINNVVSGLALQFGIFGGGSANVSDEGSGSDPGGSPFPFKRHVSNALDKRQTSDIPSSALQNEAVQSILIEFVKWQIPVLVVVGLGLLLAILIPLTGCCFCCCRLCGKCGGSSHKYRSTHQNAKCCTFSLIFLATNMLIIVGVVLGYLSNDQMAKGISSFDDTADFALQNGVAYVTNTIDEVVALATDQLDPTTDAIISDIENIGSVLGGRIEEAVEPEASLLQNASDTLFDNFDSIRTRLLSVDSSVTTLIQLQDELNATLELLQEAFQNLTASCAGNSMCEDLVPTVASLNGAVDFNDAENVTDALDVLDTIIDVESVRALIQGAVNISGFLTQTLDTSAFNRSSIDDIQGFISGTVLNIQNATSTALSENSTLGGIQNGLEMADTYISIFETARYAAGSVLISLILAIWVVFTMGVFCGLFGYSREAIPYDRSAVSHCGAMLLLSAVGLCFITGGLLVVLSSIMFYLSTGLQKACNDLAPGQYVLFQRVLDDPAVWNGSTLIGAVTSSTLGIPLNISVTDFLDACHNDESLYNALQADSIQGLNLTAIISGLLNNLQNFNLTEFDTQNISSRDFVSDAQRQMLLDAQNSLLSSISLPDYQQALNQSEVGYALLDIDNIHSNLTTLASVFQGLMEEEAGNDTLEIRDDIVSTLLNNTMQSIQQEIDRLQETVLDLEMNIASINASADAVLSTMDSYFSNLSAVIPIETGAYLDQILGYIFAYADFVVDAAMNDVGRCGPIADAYDAIHATVCEATLNGLNGFWFSIGWCVAFLLMTLVAGAILSSYFRRGPQEIKTISDEESMSYRENNNVVLTNHHVLHNTTVHPDPQQIPLHTPAYGWDEAFHQQSLT